MKIEDLFIKSLGSVDKLRWYLDNNINLVAYLNAMKPQLMFLATMTTSLIPKNKLVAEVGGIDYQRILKILVKERNDLYKILNTERGVVWLQREINSFKNYFLK